jgi:hypothetical protein
VPPAGWRAEVLSHKITNQLTMRLGRTYRSRTRNSNGGPDVRNDQRCHNRDGTAARTAGRPTHASKGGKNRTAALGHHGVAEGAQPVSHGDAYLEAADQAAHLAHGVISSGVPEKLTPGYWNVACQCCGAAAEVDFFLSLWLATGQSEYPDFARRVADQLISRETNLDGRGYRWYQSWTRIKPWEVNAETGYKIGASGIGAALVQTHLAVEDRYSAILFPDNPFPRTQRT